MQEKNIQTKTVNKNVAKTNSIKLTETPETKVGFIPTLHSGGVTGNLVKYKKTSTKKWEELKDTDFKSHALAPMEKVIIKLDTKATKKFITELETRHRILEKGIQNGENEYEVIEKGTSLIINDQNKLPLLRKILNEGHSDEFWKLLAESNPDLASKLAAGHIQQIRAATILKLKQRLKNKYPETEGPDSWQKWIFEHNWLFGANYQKPIEKQKLNITGVMPDYLFPRIDGFVDLLEIKLPTDAVLVEDKSHSGSYRWNAETSEAIGQVVTYLSAIEGYQFEIERVISRKHDRNVSMLKPRAFILIGNSDGWPRAKLEALRKLNDYLHGIEVLTYQELIHRGRAFLEGSTFESSPKTNEDEIPF